jgi:hypothetical protein
MKFIPTRHHLTEFVRHTALLSPMLLHTHGEENANKSCKLLHMSHKSQILCLRINKESAVLTAVLMNIEVS